METVSGNLDKLLLLLQKIVREPENISFTNKLQKILATNKKLVQDDRIDSIYELCIRKITKEHAENFYKDFKIQSIKETLIEDFIRAEKFRRENTFLDFSLAVFQQVENIVITLFNEERLRNYYRHNSNLIYRENRSHSHNPGNQATVMRLVGFNNFEFEKWSFNLKLKAILFYYYFNQKIFNDYSFNQVFYSLYDLYLIRNQNHRGENLTITEKQKDTIEKILKNKEKHYFKFLGLLEDFVTTINNNLPA